MSKTMETFFTKQFEREDIQIQNHTCRGKFLQRPFFQERK